ncbi:ankyrin repeat domain-containing protein [Corynebacterium gallinarum]|uniref:Ankyrin repeat domain-containing protein n=1 Tax=Corynebacterium gallinarum TaxID=2762214 RepID=A0A8I0HM82_9CORY|nr:ankyrin repeat domain-containing protein [Corynebacterium gallinarum]MBD8029114.1 ankyrin repeat domain-containing protein [Corynebacterium gallinarum]NMB22778.1 ankyrin repeat domain-containing protein [Corynebacterium sp.]
MTESQLPDDVQELVNRLFGYAREGGEEASQALDAYLQNGLDPNLSNQDGNSLVMLAAYAGNLDVLDVLIKHRANVNKLNNRQQSPLAGAIFKKEDEIIDRLLAAGADPTWGTPNAIDTARMFGREDLVARFES